MRGMQLIFIYLFVLLSIQSTNMCFKWFILKHDNATIMHLLSEIIIYWKYCKSFDWLIAVGEIVISSWHLSKFGVMTSPWYIENKYTTLWIISLYIEKQCNTIWRHTNLCGFCQFLTCNQSLGTHETMFLTHVGWCPQ